MSSQSFDPEHPDLGWQTAIPEPFWIRERRGWFRRVWVPACYPCGERFEDEFAYGAHYLREHASSA